MRDIAGRTADAVGKFYLRSYLVIAVLLVVLFAISPPEESTGVGGYLVMYAVACALWTCWSGIIALIAFGGTEALRKTSGQ